MARSKKTESDNSTTEIEGLEAIESQETDSLEAQPEKKPPQVRTRKPRARKPASPQKKIEPTASLLESMSEIAEEPQLSKGASTVEPELTKLTPAASQVVQSIPMDGIAKETLSQTGLEKSPDIQKAIEFFESLRRQQSPSDSLSQDLSLTHATFQTSMETMAKQWITVKEMSASVCTNLERVNTLLRETPSGERAKAPSMARPQHMMKIALGISAFSIVFSIVSLLLSQSARQAALERNQISAVSNIFPQSKVSVTSAPQKSNLGNAQIKINTRPELSVAQPTASESLSMVPWQGKRSTKSIPIKPANQWKRKK